MLLLLNLSVMSDSLRPHGLQHARLPCPSPSPRAYSNSCPLSRDAIQPSCLLSFPSPSAFSLSQHQGLFQWVSSSHQVAKELVLQLQHQSFQWTPRTIGWTVWISLQSKGLSRVFSNTTVQKHQFLAIELLYGPTLTSLHDYWKNHSFDYMDFCWQSNVSAF